MRRWSVFVRFTSFDARWHWLPSLTPMPDEGAVDILWGRYCLTLGWSGPYQPGREE